MARAGGGHRLAPAPGCHRLAAPGPAPAARTACANGCKKSKPHTPPNPPPPPPPAPPPPAPGRGEFCQGPRRHCRTRCAAAPAAARRAAAATGSASGPLPPGGGGTCLPCATPAPHCAPAGWAAPAPGQGRPPTTLVRAAIARGQTGRSPGDEKAGSWGVSSGGMGGAMAPIGKKRSMAACVAAPARMAGLECLYQETTATSFNPPPGASTRSRRAPAGLFVTAAARRSPLGAAARRPPLAPPPPPPPHPPP